ncbi:MAG: Hint domain-containing protein [Actinomycetales bacterium]
MRVGLAVLVRGVLVTLIAVLTSWLSMATPATALLPAAASGAMCTYCAPTIAVAPADYESERGWPAYAYGHADAYDGVDRESRGDSMRPKTAATGALTAHRPTAKLPDARDGTTTGERIRRHGQELASVGSSNVAAKTAAKACSFSGSTLVLMADGTKKPIDQIKVGDKVLATDPETGEQKPTKVEHVFVHDDWLTDLELADGTVLTTTEDHPYWSVDDRRFERADELSGGERVLGADGRTITVVGLRLATTHDGLAYNLAVQGIHTYHVGDHAILVHNTCLTALRGWSSSRFQFGNAQFQLDKSGMSHILQRHHPSYWDGSAKASQTFFDESMSIADVESAIGVVARGNRSELIRIGAGTGQVQGSVNGVNYVLGVSRGRIGQFYPGTLP